MNREKLVKVVIAEANKLGGQSELARECGISAAYINQFIKGHRNPPARLLAYLGYTEKPTEYVRIK